MRNLIPLLFLVLATLGTPVVAQERYLGAFLGSKHFGNDFLNNNTPGLTLGYRWPGERADIEWFAEGGVFYNSYEEVSPIALFGVSTSIAQVRSVDIRAGIAIGIARYDELSVRLKDRYGIPNIDGFIPIVAASLALRRGPNEIRFTAVPPDTDTDFILNLSITRAF